MTTPVKTCFKCGAEKPLTEFYKHKRMADGHLNKCKECTKRDVNTNRYEKLDYYQAYDRERSSEDHRVVARREYQPRYRSENPEKYKAHTILNNAVRDGKVVKTACEVCGATKRVHGHHDDYSKPLDVKWLCTKHHQERHRRLNLPF